MGRVLKIVIAVVVVAGVAGGVAAWYLRRGDQAPTYRTVPVKKTDILQAISATGTVVPEDVIDVGAQVNGPIAAFGKDKDGKQVDYRSSVDEGMVLAKIDDTIYAADVASGEAQLSQAQAQVALAQANREQAVAKLDQAQRDWDRAQRLGPSAALARVDYDAAQSAFEQAKAGVGVADATIGQARAAVASADANLQRARHNLAYCTITSPVSGVIIDRRVEIGQTVVASFNAPSLFLIAKDLSRMQVLVQVNEADIGNVSPGQAITFTADAFQDRTFKGSVRKVRLNATMTQNVVTYTVEIVTDNADLKLLPYLTANVKFEVARRADVLAVPNAALRFTPRQGVGVSDPPASAATAQGGQPARTDPPAGNGASGGSGKTGSGGREGRTRKSTVWVLDPGGSTPRAVEVKAGISDGALTQVDGDGIKEGDTVIVGEVVATAAGAPAGTTNPFQPQFPGRGGGGGGGGRPR